MLLDEPFGAIDAITRNNLQDELLRLHGGLKKTFLFVTHDIAEAVKLGDRVVVMNQGKVCQFDTPMNIIREPLMTLWPPLSAPRGSSNGSG